MPKKKHVFRRQEIEVNAGGMIPPRRAQVFELAACGKATKEIARELGVSPETVNWHLDELKDQFGATSRVDLVSQGWMHGILSARQAVRALALFLAILSTGPAIRTCRSLRSPASRVVQSQRIGRRETTREIGGLS